MINLISITKFITWKELEKYKIKNEMIKIAKEIDYVLVLEFHYGQNLPLAKLNVTKKIYKRIIWFYGFNVHNHRDDTLFFYTFIESEAKKDS